MNRSLATLVMFLYFADAYELCPENCSCVVHKKTRFYAVSCRGFPVSMYFPSSTASITISGADRVDIPSGTFSNLKHLKNLKIVNSRIDTLLNASLDGLANLQNITLRDCYIKRLELAVFKSLVNIRHIDLSENHYIGFPIVTRALSLIPNKHLIESLNLKFVNDRTYTSVLKRSFFKYLNMKNLKSLCLSSNELSVIETGFQKYIPSLEMLVLSYNVIAGEYKAFYEIFTLKHLRYLDLSNQNSYSNTHNEESSLYSSNFLSMAEKDPADCLQYPPYLETIHFHNFRSLSIGDTPWIICSNNSVKIYDLSMIDAKRVNSIRGLEVVEYLSFRNNEWYYIGSKTFFENFPKLKTLLVGENNLSYYFENDINGSLFKRNIYLESLDISYNKVKFLPSMFLKSLSHLNILNASGNNIEDIGEFHVFNRPSVINLSHNAISDVPPHVMTAFETWGTNFTLDISNNPLSVEMACCSIKKFIAWVRTTKIYLAHSTSYICMHNNGLVHITSLPDSFLQKQCPTFTDKQFTGILSVLLIFVIIVCVMSMCYRKRLVLMWWTIQMKRYTRLKADAEIGDDVIYDAFICYSGDDILWVRNNLETELEVKRGYRLCIHERDFVPGNPIDENIVTAIQQSRRTVLLLTKSFQESEWCDFEVRMANRHSRCNEQCIIIPVVFSSFDISKASLLLRSIIDEKSYINWNTNRNHKRMFWDVFTKALGTPLDKIT